jgi:hypothetical protein
MRQITSGKMHAQERCRRASQPRWLAAQACAGSAQSSLLLTTSPGYASG